MMQALSWAALGTGFTFLMTTLGAAVVFFFVEEPRPQFQRTMLGFAAGVMTAASVWSLLLPAIEQSADFGVPGWLPAAAGLLLGVGFLSALDAVLPHLRRAKDMDLTRRQSTLLMAAITLHNVPEGMAVGLAFALAAEGEGMAGAAALALGILIYLVYRKFYTGVVYSRSFAVTLVGMCVLTCMVTLAISTNVVISLGMVGALSIVRFRTAVKDPLDLLYLFWSITTGITAGAGMYALGLVTAVVMIGMIYLFSHWQAKGRVYIAVIHYAGTEAGDNIVRALGRIKFVVKSKTMRGENTEMAVEVFCNDPNVEFADRVRAVEGVQDVTLIQYNGEYHG